MVTGMTHIEGAELAMASEAARLARFMGLPRWQQFNDLKLVDSVREGFPASTVAKVARQIDPEGKLFKVTDIIPRSTLHRRKDKALTKDESERVLAVSKVFAEALRLYHDDSRRVAFFLLKPHPLLGNRTPISLVLESTAGADLVLNLLARADAGIAI